MTKEEILAIANAEISRVQKIEVDVTHVSVAIAYTQYVNGLRFVMSLVEKLDD